MDLAGWELELAGKTTKGEWAHIVVHRAKSYATVAIADSLFSEPGVVQRQAFCHELCHIHLAALDWSHEDSIEGQPVKVRRLARRVWDQRSEKATDDLARLIALGLPLPPWKTP
jgi:hypothetical protein